MNPTPPTIDASERRIEVARVIDPRAWHQRQLHLDRANGCEFQDHADQWDVRADDVVAESLRLADRILALLAASSGERIASSDEMLCEGCGKSINRGQFVHVYDDVGEVHVDCDQPNAFSDDPMAMVMVGDPMRRIAPSAKASSGERGAWQDGLWQIVLSVHGDRVRSTETNIALREALSKAAKQFRSYEKAHNEKNTDDGDKKAVTNAEFAVMCERAANLEPRQSKAEIMAEIRALATPATVEEGKV